MNSGKSHLLAYLRKKIEKMENESTDEEKEEDKKLCEQFLKETEKPERKVFFIEGHF